ncbi:MAG: YcxB family protein [Eubacterium sp.]|jgi:hypothetical protein|nr:YcxB family protein [Eubacterium sp.]
MKAEFEITLSSKDMYRFSMYHAYTGSQGILSILIAIICFVAAFYSVGTMEIMYTVLYAAFGVLFLVYIPFQLYIRSKQQIMKSEVLRNALHYVVDESGIHASQNDASADLPWDAVYKMVSTKNNVFVYSSRVNAYIIPKSQLGTGYETLRQLAKEHLPKYRFKMK